MEQPEPDSGGENIRCGQCGNRKDPRNEVEFGRNRWLARRYAQPAIVCVVCASILVADPAGRAKAGAQKRYVTTVWTRTYDFDGLVEDFAILGETTGILQHAVEHLSVSAQRLIAEDLKRHPGWARQEFDDYKQGFCQVNSHNTVIGKDWAKIGDGTVYNSTYYYFEAIEVPGDRQVDETLFTRDGECPWEVTQFFKQQRKSWPGTGI